MYSCRALWQFGLLYWSLVKSCYMDLAFCQTVKCCNNLPLYRKQLQFCGYFEAAVGLKQN